MTDGDESNADDSDYSPDDEELGDDVTDGDESEGDDFDQEDVGDLESDQSPVSDETDEWDSAFEDILPEGAANDDELEVIGTRGERVPKSPPPPDPSETIPLELNELTPEMEKFIDERVYLSGICLD